MKTLRQFRHIDENQSPTVKWDSLTLPMAPSVFKLSPSGSFLATLNVDSNICSIFALDCITTRIISFCAAAEYVNAICQCISWSADESRLCVSLDVRGCSSRIDPTTLSIGVVCDLKECSLLKEIAFPFLISSLNIVDLGNIPGDVLIAQFSSSQDMMVMKLDSLQPAHSQIFNICFSNLSSPFQAVNAAEGWSAQKRDNRPPLFSISWPNQPSNDNCLLRCDWDHLSSPVVGIASLFSDPRLGLFSIQFDSSNTAISVSGSVAEIWSGNASVDVLAVCASPCHTMLVSCIRLANSRQISLAVIGVHTNTLLQLIPLQAGELLGLSCQLNSCSVSIASDVDGFGGSAGSQPRPAKFRRQAEENRHATTVLQRRGLEFEKLSTYLLPAQVVAVQSGSKSWRAERTLHANRHAVRVCGSPGVSAQLWIGRAALNSHFAGSMYPAGFRVLMESSDHIETETELDLEPAAREASLLAQSRSNGASTPGLSTAGYKRCSQEFSPSSMDSIGISMISTQSVVDSSKSKDKPSLQHTPAIAASTVAADLMNPLQFYNPKRVISTNSSSERPLLVKKSIPANLLGSIQKDLLEAAKKSMERKGKRKIVKVQTTNNSTSTSGTTENIENEAASSINGGAEDVEANDDVDADLDDGKDDLEGDQAPDQELEENEKTAANQAEQATAQQGVEKAATQVDRVQPDAISPDEIMITDSMDV